MIGATATASSAKFTAPTPGLEDMIFTRGTTQDAARYADIASKLAQHVGTETWSQSTIAMKAMIELVALVYTAPVRPTKKYFTNPLTTPQVVTNDRFSTNGTTEYIKVVEDIEWKLDLEEYLVAKKKHTRDAEAWTENSARIYNLVLQHYLLELEAELRNHSSWSAGQSA